MKQKTQKPMTEKTKMKRPGDWDVRRQFREDQRQELHQTPSLKLQKQEQSRLKI